MTKESELKTFEVLITAYKTVIVEASSEDEAMEIASEECTSSDWEADRWSIEKELKTANDIDQAKRSGAIPIEDWRG